ncbi:kinesin, putative [Bodo saltans]|uniref:Kinesin-like protein n=1 Tax=Bodo saltans TaxID=75058 RepID=A0A0S4IP41_BODSA|nr:kinesin, putative [Bodo saltans]|eukprot:CUE69671.1 kinesin, putative [Bodo saltans]
MSSIKIFLRVRPDRNRKPFDQRFTVDHTFENSTIRFHVDRKSEADVVNHSVENYNFNFDRVFEPKATQEDIFNMVAKDCVLSALDGFNSTIFAYGQTGSGKTYSITGGTESYNDRGIIPRSLSLIFEEVAKRTDYEWTVRISYLQIYNDKGQDLLNRGKDARTLDDLPPVTIHESDDDIVMKGLEAHPSTSVHDALNLLFLGDTNRLYCETPMNKTSSRSHCIFTVSLEARAHGTATVRRSKLNLVDLAGSERVGKTGVSGNLLTEAKYINLSLHYLEHVIVALGDRQPHVPFRNSIMTMVLRDSLGGNCRTAMLATAYPTDDLFMESISTCKFAQRVAKITQNAHVNEETDPVVLVRKLKAEIAQLKEQVAFYTKGGESDSDRALRSDELQRCQELVQRYLEDNDPKSQITGLGGDLARVLACFAIMKTMIRSGGGSTSAKNAAAMLSSNGRVGGGGGGTSGGGGSSSGGTPATSSGMSSQQEKKLLAQVETLSVSLQQKENELSLLFQMVESHSAAKFNAQTQTGDAAEGVPFSRYASSQRGPAPPLPMGSNAAAASPVQPNDGGVMGVLASRSRQISQANLNATQAQVAAEYLQRQDELREQYDLSALSDAEMTKDRAAAFEAFRRSYRKFEQVEKNKADLKDLYEKCKALAGDANQCSDTIKQLKGRIVKLRAERALQGSDQPEREEVAYMDQLNTVKAQYQNHVKELGKEKERVDHMHLIINRAQEQLAKDFEEWFSLRQKQVLLAQSSRGDAQQQPTNSGAPPARAQQLPSNTLEPMFPPIGQRHSRTPPEPSSSIPLTSSISSSIMSQIQASQHQRPTVSSAPQDGTSRVTRSPPPPTSGVGAPGQRPVPQQGNFVAEQHQRLLAEHAQHNQFLSTVETKNPYAPSYPSTGNSEADAQLAEMYKAREEMRNRLLGR